VIVRPGNCTNFQVSGCETNRETNISKTATDYESVASNLKTCCNVYHIVSNPFKAMLLLLTITAVLTTLIVWGASWIKRNREKHPAIYQHRRIIGALVWLILNI
jgi:hypothetical protein